MVMIDNDNNNNDNSYNNSSNNNDDDDEPVRNVSQSYQTLMQLILILYVIVQLHYDDFP